MDDSLLESLDTSLGPALDAVMEDERIVQPRLFASADVREGTMAFVEKACREVRR